MPGFSWSEDWASAGDHGKRESRRWAHHGIATTASGLVVTMSANGGDVVTLSPQGSLIRRWQAPVVEGHGLTSSMEEDREVLWIADTGISAVPGSNGRYESQRRASGQYGSIVKLDLHGIELQRLDMPPCETYATGNFAPTDVAVDERWRGGSGDVWVADGYGRHLVHRYNEAGDHLATISGESGLGHFDQPHAITVDRRQGRPEIYVADRGNARIQVFDDEGVFIRGVGVGRLVSPGGFAVSGSTMFVSELDARVTMLDDQDNVVGVLGQRGRPDRKRAGWPNQLDHQGRPMRPALHAGLFNTPHGIAADTDGNIYVSEWVIGGRLIKLTKIA